MNVTPATQRLFRAVACGLAYAGVAAVTVANTRFGGGVAYLWVASALLVAQLTLLPRRHWLAPCVATFIASVFVTVMVGLGPVAAVPIGLVNIGEAALAAALLRRVGPETTKFDSVERLAALVLAACAAAAISGFAGAGVATACSDTAYWSNWINWVTGHALGTVAFTPVARMALGGEIARCVGSATRAERAEMAGLLTLVAVTAVIVFAQSMLPLLFLPILPVILATFRLGQLGASISVVLVTLIGGWYTLRGLGPINLIDASVGERAQFFQFYLAITVLTALPVAADLSRRRRLFEQLRDSEARYRLITDHSSDIVLNVDVEGRIRFISPSITAVSGHDPASLVGGFARALIIEDDRATAIAAHRRALAAGGETTIVEYRGVTATGEERWFESHSRAVLDEHGAATGVVSVVRDVAHRKSVEAELSRVAATDPLTGLANRRAFHLELARRMQLARDKGLPSCVAIFDLDHFKGVNDRWGHDVGDRVLEAFADAARRSVREHDLVARLGGEEFGIILAGASAEQARTVCERLRAAIAGAPMAVEAAVVPMTVSAGIAVLDGSIPPEEVLRAADAALYRAKRAGRNRLDLAA